MISTPVPSKTSPARAGAGALAQMNSDPALGQRLQARAVSISARLDTQTEARLFAAAANAPTARKRLIWLQRAADVFDRAVRESDAVACRKGCSHCCHIGLTISRAEAQHLADVTGRSMQDQPVGCASVHALVQDLGPDDALPAIRALQDRAVSRHTGTPCPFLDAQHSCSVYADRPLACRLHYSVADDDDPCRVIDENGLPRTMIPVPYVDTLRQRAQGLLILGVGHDTADIRDWFPNSGRP